MAKKETASATSPEEQLKVKQTEMLEAKRSHAAGELLNPRVLGRLRKDIARLHTQLHASAKKSEEK